ncbi:hypothetical protein [Streptacidiphilus sp. PAMC 29251]
MPTHHPRRNTGSGSEPGRQPFGSVRLERPIDAVPPPATVRHPPTVPLGPSVPIPVLSFESLRRLP